VGVAHDGQSAAGGRSVGAEGGHDDPAAWLQVPVQRGEVVLPFVWLGQEVEDGPVVPQRVAAPELQVEHVGDGQDHAGPAWAEPFSHGVQRGDRQVDRRQVGVPALEEVVHQRRPAGTDVDHRLGAPDAGGVHQPE